MMEQSIEKLNQLQPAQLKELLNPQGKIVLQRVPRFSELQNIGHAKVIEVLRMCPLSSRFGESIRTLNVYTESLRSAKLQAEQIIRKWGEQKQPIVISEVSHESQSSYAKSSVSSIRIRQPGVAAGNDAGAVGEAMNPADGNDNDMAIL